VAKGYLSELFVSFQGEGLHVGRRHLFVRLSGCNIRCRYCDTPDSLVRENRFSVHRPGAAPIAGRNPLTPAETRTYALQLLEGSQGVDGISVTGGEPLLQAEFIAELLADARLPRPRLLETNGMLPDRLTAVLPFVDVISMDIKLPSNTGEAAFWAEHERFLSIGRGKTYVKVLADASTDPADVERAALVVRAADPDIPVFLQPITSPDHSLDLAAAQLGSFFSLLRQHLNDVRVLPQTHKMLRIR
jgi:organic radical activating enzyme